MPAEFTIRRGTPGDNCAAFDVSMLAMKDLFLRHGYEWKLDQPAIVLHFETLVQSRGMETVSFQVPSINVVVMDHLLKRGYKIDTPPGFLMSSREFGRFDRFLPFAPAIVL